VGELVNGRWEWKLVWRRGLFDWKDSVFTVKFAYHILRGTYEGDSLFVSLWKTFALPSAQFTTWRVLLNSITSKDNLERQGVAIVSNLCCFCKVEVESTRHLFFECRVTWLVWNKCYAWLGLTSIDHRNPVSHFSHFKLINVPNQVNVVWGSIDCSCWWNLETHE